jgi:tetratricopeptide (TPR) repeat protein
MLPEARILAASKGEMAIELVSRASKDYEAGAYTTALAAIEEAFKLGLDNELAARAILLRAECLEKSGMLARALADYSSALWMQNLPASERKKATEGKERVIAAMGLNTPAQHARPSEQASASAAQSQQSGSSSGVFGMFSGLFGSSSDSQPAPAREPQKTAQTSAPPTAVGSWKTEAEQAPAEPAKRSTHTALTAAHIRETSAKPTAKPAPQPQASTRTVTASASATASASGDGFHIDFGAANSEGAARSRAQQIKAQLSDILVHRELEVSSQGGGGFHILAGPYKSRSAAVSLCSAMKQRGVSCQVTP